MNIPTHQQTPLTRAFGSNRLWPMALTIGIGMALFLLLLCVATRSSYAQGSDHTQEDENRLSPLIGSRANAEQNWIATLQTAALGTDAQVHTSKPVVSPNGRFAAVTVVPLGNETAFLARTQIYEVATSKVRHTFPGYLPHWLDGGSTLQLETMDRGLATYAIDEAGHANAGFQEVRAIAPTTAPATATNRMDNMAAINTQQSSLRAATYPDTIRVAHHPSNGCRDLPEWQVDTIPFEEYIARVVPAETPSWWPIDALAAQAVAARTYAWRQILVGRADYDVTDWANFQMMCDARTQNSDSATDMTQGQYLVALDDDMASPISAMYSAENGHPTLTNSNVTYLQSVPDRFGLGRVRYGHGYGLSQWGAYRRALAGQTYRQILGHYYSNIYLRNGLAPTEALGSLLGIDPALSLASDQITLRAMRPPDVTASYLISATAGLTEAVILESNGGSKEAVSWQASTSLAEGAGITASLWISGQLQDQVMWVVDHEQPILPQLTMPLTVTTAHFTLTVPTGSEGDTPLLGAGWQWAGSTLAHTSNSGAPVDDPHSATGAAWGADPALHSAGVWYGPYTTVLPAAHSYRALFWLRATIPATQTTMSAPIAHLDVADDEGRTLLGLRDLHAGDFSDSPAYTPIAVDFHLFTAPSGLEFRVNWPGKVALALDRVEIWQLPDTIESKATMVQSRSTATVATFGWRLAGYGTEQILQLRASDRAGNLSAVQPFTVTVVDQEPPTIGELTGLPKWITREVVTLTTTASDTLSGIDLATGALRISKPAFVSTPPLKVNRHGISSESVTLSAVINDLPDGIYTATFTINDQAGNSATREQPLRVDTTAPTVTIFGSSQVDNAWILEALTVTISGADDGSGLQSIHYAQQKAPEVISQTAIYTAPILMNEGGIYTTTAWSIDEAGNQSSSQSAYLRLDLQPPTLLLSQTAVNSTTVHITWQADDDGSGVAAVEFEIQKDGNGWQPLDKGQVTAVAERSAGSQREDSIKVIVDPQQQTLLRGRAVDGVGRFGDWIEMALWTPTDWIFLPLVNR